MYMYIKNKYYIHYYKSLYIYVSHVSQIGLSWSERHSARGSYTAAVDLRSLQLHHEIATLLVGA